MKKLFILVIVSFGISACTTKTTQESTSEHLDEEVEEVSLGPTVPEDDIGSYVPSDEFSVDSLGRKIKFSPGNLQYRASTETWRFAENQYDILGEYNAEISAFNEGWIDLFGWGTGDNPTISNLDFNYYENFTDWGENIISNGEKNVTWRTLTRDEWLYLFCNRENAVYRFGFGCVNDVNGIIILPDKWHTPEGLVFTSSIESGVSWDDFSCKNGNAYGFADYNFFDVEDWESMEANGAIFLPAAGYRYDKYILKIGETGNYWSSTPSEEYQSKGAYTVYFNSQSLSIGRKSLYHQRHDGLSVRLVRDIK